MHPLNGALPVPYVPVRVTRGAVITHQYTNAPPRCRTAQYRRIFIPLSVSLCNDLGDPVFDGVGLAGFKSRATMPFYCHSCSLPSIILWVCIVGRGLRTDWVLIGLIGCFISPLWLIPPSHRGEMMPLFQNDL